MHKLVNGEMVELTQEEHEAIVADWQATDREYAKIKYRQDRQGKYPLIGDQLDALWKWVVSHPDLDGPAKTMALEIANVKELFPKPTE